MMGADPNGCAKLGLNPDDPRTVANTSGLIGELIGVFVFFFFFFSAHIYRSNVGGFITTHLKGGWMTVPHAENARQMDARTVIGMDKEISTALGYS